MIIDIHAHLALNKIYPSSFITGMLTNTVSPSAELAKASTIQQIIRFSRIILNDENGANLISQMDKAGISKTVLLIVDGGLALGEAELTLEEIFAIHHNVLRNFPQRVIVFGGVDPRRGDMGFRLFKKGVFDYGFKGLKLYPPMGFAMNDERLDKYYSLCSDFNLPVLIHTGPSHDFLQNELADPKNIIETAKKFKNIKFILAHAGFSLNTPSVQLATSLPNIYCDIAGFYKKFKLVDIDKMDMLEKIFHKSINQKILFGTDWPLFNIVSTLKGQVDIIHKLHNKVKKNYSKEALDNIMFRNALSVLSITA
jgi:predicted TIM-barrel fold metal-dependent hydrolase